MKDPGAALGRFDLAGGTHLTLYRNCLVQRGDTHLETLPLAGIVAVSVGFARDPRRIGWGAALVAAAVVLFVLSGPLGVLAGGAAGEMGGAGVQGVARALQALFRFIEAVASVLPFIAIACASGGAVLAALGWRGSTVLTLSLAGFERVYAARGHDRVMLEFAEALSERLMEREP